MTAAEPTPEQVLALPLGDNDAGAATVRDYLIALLRKLWGEGANFSGKRPFGNSGWEYDVYGPMIHAGYVGGAFDDQHGWIDWCDATTADRLMDAAIQALGNLPDGSR